MGTMTIFSLTMHQEMQISTFVSVLRVPGGWVYNHSGALVFVPCSDIETVKLKVYTQDWKRKTLFDIWNLLTARIRNVLRANVHKMMGANYTPHYWENVTLGELDKIPNYKLMSYHNFGVTSLTILRNVIDIEKAKI